jgi:hypothetical protein
MRFTPQNARENAVKALASRKANYLAAKEALKGESQPQTATALAAETPVTDDFTLRSLSRVRYQLERLDGMMKTETDPARLDRLAAAFGKLSEVERQLAGRPMPGSLKPVAAPRTSMFTRPVAAAPSSPPQAGPGKFEQE